MSAPQDPPFDEAQFADSLVQIHLDGVWVEFTPVSDEAGGSWPIERMIHVISGCNPGYRASVEENERRHGELEAVLRRDGREPWPAWGLARDRMWSEASWAVQGLSRHEACAYGRHFAQVAVFEIDDRCIRIVACSTGDVTSTRPYTAMSGEIVAGSRVIRAKVR